MKILEVRVNDKIDVSDYNFTEDLADRIEIHFPTYVEDDTYTTIVIDHVDYPDFDETNTDEVTKLFTDLRDCISEMEDTSVFGSEENYISVIDTLDTDIEDLIAESMCDFDYGDEDDYDNEVVDSSEETDESNRIELATITGDNYCVDYDSINWEQNAEQLNVIGEAMDSFHTMLVEMYAGKVDADDVEDTAESILNNMSIDTYYVFPMAKDVTKREMATIKMFDAFAAYSTIFAHSAIKRTELEMIQGMDFYISYFKDVLNRISENITPDNVQIQKILDEAFNVIGSYENLHVDEDDDEAIADVMEAASNEGGDVE